MPKPWKIFIWIIGVITFIVAIIVVGPFFFKGHMISVQSQLNFAAFLGTLVGGIMAAAGLVVALVSVVSFSTLDRRIEDKFQRLVKESEEERRSKTNAMFQGFALQLQSVNSGDLFDAESLLEEALELYPDLRGARRQLALRFYSSTEDAYMTKMRPINNIDSVRTNDGAMAVWNHQIQCQNFKPAPEGSFSHEAEKWLEKAREYGEDEDKLLSFCLAKLYGMRGRFDLMMKCLGVAKDWIGRDGGDVLFRVVYLRYCLSNARSNC